MNMEFKRFISTCGEMQFVIEEDLPDVGAYLYVYTDGEITSDYLQNDINACMEFALDEFKVPLDSWGENGDTLNHPQDRKDEKR